MDYSERFQYTIDRFIELYGDRTEGLGNEIRAGFAWLQEIRFVLIAMNEGVVQHPSSWRRLSRLLGLAQHFRRPVLLWNLSLQAAPADSSPTLLDRSTAQNSQLRLMKLPLPIISVFDGEVQRLLASDLAAVDAAVLIQNQSEPQHLSASMNKSLPILVRITDNVLDLKSHILALLDQISTVPPETLVHGRIGRVRRLVG
ncbi:MAG: hypothetical protein O7E52_04825 [Candidatus Poribacteria bacterium]|nr:hypothetical protein [Candidatus Poribacteria bacterium]